MSDLEDTSSDVEFNITAIYIGSIFEMSYPLILIILWIIFLKGRKGQKFLCTLFGITGFILAINFENYFQKAILGIFGKRSIIRYIILSLCPGLFEETARYIFLDILLSKGYLHKNISIGYGIGHGGIESIILGLKLFGASFEDKTDILEDINLENCLLSAVERFFAILIHISLSILVYKSVTDKKKYYYYFLIAILLHNIVDLIPLLIILKIFVLRSYLVEIIIAAISICISLYAGFEYNKLDDEL
jgi:uncharacterized membrane protein YhfC